MIRAIRSAAAPASLAEGKYRAADVRERLFFDFAGKCYLCEGPITLGSFDVEHRHPVADGGGELDWANLFPSCKTCNGGRARRYPAGGLLNPDVNHDIEDRILQSIGNLSEEPPAILFAAIDGSDLPATNTAHELHSLHVEKGARSRDLQAAIMRRLLVVHSAVTEMFEAEKVHGVQSHEYVSARETVRGFVSRRSPFTALVRSSLRRFASVAALFD